MTPTTAKMMKGLRASTALEVMPAPAQDEAWDTSTPSQDIFIRTGYDEM